MRLLIAHTRTRMSQNQRQAERPVIGEGLARRIPALVDTWRASRKAGSHDRSGPLSRREIETAGAALLELQRGLTGDRRLAGSGYMDDPDLLGAYLLYYWPVSYLQASLAFAELPPASAIASSGAGRRILDLGSGPGPASAAVLDAGATACEVVLVDASKRALDLARSILDRGDNPPSRVESRVLDLESEEALPEGPFDLVILSHCLNELWRGEPEALDRRLSLLRRAAKTLAPGGKILILEPALLLTSRELIALRDRLAGEFWKILCPCPGSYPCPILAAGSERSCHAEAAWAPIEPVASLAAAAGLDRSSVKCAYFLLSPPGQGNPPEGEFVISRRVVSDHMLNKAGRLRFILCGERTLLSISAKADDKAARAAGFMDLRRGDSISFRGFEERPGGGAGFAQGSSIELLALAPTATAMEAMK
jgi:SAM-dependent methyltransferase